MDLNGDGLYALDVRILAAISQGMTYDHQRHIFWKGITVRDLCKRNLGGKTGQEVWCVVKRVIWNVLLDMHESNK